MNAMVGKRGVAWRAALTAALGGGVAAALHAQSPAGIGDRPSGDATRDQASAANRDDEAVELDRLVVIGQRPRIDVEDRVERGQAQAVRDLFALDPAVNIGGGTRNGQRLFLRGIEGSNLNVTVDGARQGQNLYNHRGGLGNVDPELVKRVDVAPGPAAADAGYGALAGSIRFETIDAQDRLAPGQRVGGLVKASAASANNARRGAAALFAEPAQGLGLLAFATATNFDDLRIGGGTDVPFSAGRDRSALLKLSVLDGETHRLRVAAERNDAFGFNFMQRGDYPYQVQPPSGTRPPQAQTLLRETFTANYRFDPGSPWHDWKVSAYDSSNDFDAPNSNGERFISDVRGGDVRNTLTVASGGWSLATTAGADYLDEDNLALQNTGVTRFATGTRNTGLFVQNRLSVGRALASFGARRDDFSTDYGPRRAADAVTSLNGSGEFALGGGWRLHGGYGESARGNGNMPLQFTRNIARALTFNGAADGVLLAERGRQSEVGLRFEDEGVLGADRVEFGATGFLTRIDDAILYRQPGSGGLGGRPVTDIYNQEQAVRYQGYEVRGLWARDRWLTQLAVSDVDIRNLPSEAQFIARAGAPIGGKLVWDTRYALSDAWSFGYTLTGAQRADDIPSGQGVYIPRPGYVLHDVQAVWRPRAWSGFSLALAAYNLGDRRYSNPTTLTQGGFATEEPGRDLRVTASYAF